jgi:four helix bundle protein
VNKLSVVEEEADECAFWMELMVDSGLVTDKRLAELMEEANQLTAIVVASRRTCRRD